MIKNLNRNNLGRIRKLINLSFTNGYVPTAWKLAKLYQLLKSGKDLKLLESYRPISLLECLGELMERIVVDLGSSVICPIPINSDKGNQSSYKSRCPTS